MSLECARARMLFCGILMGDDLLIHKHNVEEWQRADQAAEDQVDQAIDHDDEVPTELPHHTASCPAELCCKVTSRPVSSRARHARLADLTQHGRVFASVSCS